MSHTPGPWEADGMSIFCKQGKLAKYLAPTENAEEDVKLIAAAPDMYNFILQIHGADRKCCEEMLPGSKIRGRYGACIVLRKAEGKE